MDAECDLVIRGGTVVTPGSSAECDLGISDGRISQIGSSLRGRRQIDAAGALIVPGGRARGLPVFVETRPLYLYLTREALREPQGAWYIGAPPLREPADVQGHVVRPRRRVDRHTRQ
jgi:dihydroorotase-like cyclic amidohydrolase